VIEHQIAQSDQDDLFENIIGWRTYPWDWITIHPTNVVEWQAQRTRLRTELSFNDTQLDAWLAARTVDAPVVVGSRTYIKRAHVPGGSSFYLQSYITSQVPAGVEFEYARTSKGDYLAESYTFAVSRPQWLHTVLPAAQLAWWKRVVFHTPENMQALARQAALTDPALTEFLARGSQLFTWEQLDDLLNEMLLKYRQPSGQAAA
jgi:hypothetical protein